MKKGKKVLRTSGFENEPIKELKSLFKKEGLDFPVIPEKFYPRLQEISKFLYSTRDDEVPDPYNLEWYLNEIQTKKVDDYLIIGNTGHGANSWAMHVYFVDGPFACFLQKRWGGAFSDEKRDREEFNKALLAVDHIREHLLKAQKENKLEANRRLVLVESDFSSNKWAWIEEGSGVLEAGKWNTEEPTFLLAWNSVPK